MLLIPISLFLFIDRKEMEQFNAHPERLGSGETLQRFISAARTEELVATYSALNLLGPQPLHDTHILVVRL